MRAAWTGLIALDNRLAHVAHAAREPIMAQLRLAWWRDRLGEPASAWPRGEPLLALLGAWDAERAALVALVEGHEAQGVGGDGGAARDQARAGSIHALARLAGMAVTPAIAAAAVAWAEGAPIRGRGLPRALRPLLLLRHFDAARDQPGWRVLAGAIRKGWFGV